MKDETNVIGHWCQSKHDENESYLPLYTRFQPRFCRGKIAGIDDRCKQAMDLTRFEPYGFNFSEEVDLGKLLEGKSERICFVGASHAGTLVRYAKAVVAVLNMLAGTNIQFDHLEYFYASDLTKEAIDQIISNNCTKVVVGTGQWDAGWPGGRPTSFIDYKLALNDAIQLIMKMFPSSIHAFYRSTHYNPIGDRIGACPATDWRSPPVIDMYNEIAEMACKAHSMPWIDTRDVMSVMWDRAGDWCHYDDVTSEVEAIHILRTIFL